MVMKHGNRRVEPKGERSPTDRSASLQAQGRWPSGRDTEVTRLILSGATLDAHCHRLGALPATLSSLESSAQ